MGNTNIPQFGAAGTDNSRDTRSGTDQLTDEQRKQSAQGEGGTQPPPDTVPPPVPGQTRDTPHREDLEQTGEDEDERTDQGPDIPPPAPDKRAYEGHHNTGYSPSDAT